MACSGRGTPEVQPDGSTLCRCAPPYNGVQDLFNEQVTPELAWDCRNNSQAQQGIWALVCIIGLVRMLVMWHTLAALVRSKGMPTSFRKAFEYMPFRVLCLDGFVATPLILVCAFLKASTQRALGTDPVASVTFTFGMGLVTWIHADFTSEEFAALTKARNMGQSSAGSHLAAVYRRFQFVQWTVVFLGGYLPIVIGLALDPRLPPLQSGMWYILVIRNAGVIVYCAVTVQYVVRMRRESSTLLGAVSSSNADLGPTTATTATAGGGEGGRSVAQTVVQFLDQQIRVVGIVAVVSGTMYAVMATPPLWPYNTYSIAVTLFISAIGANDWIVLYRFRKGQAKHKQEQRQLEGGPRAGGDTLEVANPMHSARLVSSPVGRTD